jgi:cell division protein FtsQ
MTGSVPTDEHPAPNSGRSRRRWVATAGLIGATLMVVAAVVLNSPWMSVRHIEILGSVRADVAGRLSGSGVGEGAIMIWLRPGRIEEDVLADPWVLDVRVERVFPDRLVIEVLERTPSVAILGGESWMLVSGDGTVLEVGDAPAAGLLQVEIGLSDHTPGERPQDPTWIEVVELSTALSADLAGRSRLVLRQDDLWIETGGSEARLGRAVDLAEKGRALVALMEHGLPEGAVIDLIAPDRPAVTLPSDGTPDTQPDVEG